ncbi:Integral membrane channel protein [Pleurostoma richardsiae]|uniref:Integral membrane channel protein n=1 Tax=Pleurostoma richardsiae TaxID=41990 RepID=A0AA38RJ05_9PEZI|nr:Integral membrane channel protein [Pleurostoma richardsiae]
MLSKLLRPFAGNPRLDSPSPGPSSPEQVRLRYATADFTEADDDDDDNSDDGGVPFRHRSRDDEDGHREPSAVLPLFSATHLDSLPVYSITHAIRIIVQTRTETTLTWEQLRSPQVSQFLVKPMQQQIRTQHFSKATLYALMANCLQFAKEGQLYPGNAGTSSTRSKVCELLAIKLLKEYSTRELIDALAYDFYPLQGLPGHQTSFMPGGGKGLQKPGAARTSTLEVAIRASAKHFLAHPLVVQQLEGIWNGAISFYSAADNIHRQAKRQETPVPSRRQADPRTPLLGHQLGKETQDHLPFVPPGRRTVTLYDPRNASLFKLSRLRVPRYRQFLSTCSLAVLIGLFLAVLIERSSSITTLELVFWFWSAGFMLDELVGFTEQGFSLYIMSFWNIFDLGILLLLILYYCMRLYGVFLVDSHKWNDNAYDILAANAILLLPRIFSVLDHYQYFSQLLIAFRLMAVDLAAVFILVLISCSGFFVFFTLSRNDNDAGEVAYKIFQLLMGFTPAAWEVWPNYDYLERTLMAFFLIICHFVVVTILITVLTNSFMAIASNATEEHQFLFAINTISMVKNDALFSYVAPSNIFAWALMPLSTFPIMGGFRNDGISRRDHAAQAGLKDTDAEGDDELVTNDEDEDDNATNTVDSRASHGMQLVEEDDEDENEDYFTTPVAARFRTADPSSLGSGSALRTHTAPAHALPTHAHPAQAASPRPARRGLHSRTLSTNTILYNPPADSGLQGHQSSSPSPERPSHTRTHALSNRNNHLDSPGGPGHHSPRRTAAHQVSRPRPILPPRDEALTAPARPFRSLANETAIPTRRTQPRRLSSLDLAIDNTSDLAAAAAQFDAVPSSFVTQMAMATGMVTPMGLGPHGDGAGSSRQDSDRMSRLVLARMKTLEEGLADVVREMRVLQQRSSGYPSAQNSASEGGSWRESSDPNNPTAAGVGVETAERGERSGAARKPRTAPSSRPLSRRSGKGPVVGFSSRAKGKGKEVPQSDADESDGDNMSGMEGNFAPKRRTF